MAERDILKARTLQYEGYFKALEVYKIIEDFAKENDYDKGEFSNQEQVIEEGKFIKIFNEIARTVSDYVIHKIRVVLQFEKLMDKDIKVDGKKDTYQEGLVRIILTPLIETDYEGTMEQKPFYFFMRVVYEKFIYSKDLRLQRDRVEKDADMLIGELRAYLNMHKLKGIKK